MAVTKEKRTAAYANNKQARGANADSNALICRHRPLSSSRFSLKSRRSLHRSSLFLIIFFIAMQLPQASPKEIQSLLCRYLHYSEECNFTLAKSLNESLQTNGTYCPGSFDGFVCWPYSLAGTFVQEPCPHYLDYENDTFRASRFCLTNGSWHGHLTDEGWRIWDHRDDCRPINEDELNKNKDESDLEMAMLTALGMTYTVGYAISLVCLVIALILFTYFRKLHCIRNYIHMNLMISFILRYTTVLIKDRVIQSHYDLDRFHDYLSEEEMKLFCDDYGGVSGYMISCRMVISLMHYAILANYFWLLAEGLYLQLILSFPMMDIKENKFFPFFMAGGWGAPWIPVGIWIVLRITLENEGCWEMYESPNIWWCIRAPVIASIVINFIIFINILRIIITKLRAHNLKRNDKKMTLAKSTLALIPLLGIHYIVFLAITDDGDSFNVIMKVKIAFEMVLTSIQGMLIAVFYCFLNGEVRGEVVKFWKNLRLRKGLPSSTYRKTSTFTSNGTQFTAVTYTNSEDKSQVLQETQLSLLSANNRCDSGKNSRRSTMSSNEVKSNYVNGSHVSLVP